jgi:hypothetical protein
VAAAQRKGADIRAPVFVADLMTPGESLDLASYGSSTIIK